MFVLSCLKNVSEFIFLSSVKRKNLWRTIRALPINDDDSRLSEIFVDSNNPNFITILSGKVTTCWKIAMEVKNMINGKLKRDIVV